MDHAPPLPFLRETLLFLLLAGILIPLLQRFRIHQVIAFLGLGTLLGPFGAGSLVAQWPWLQWVTFPRQQGVHALAELGVVFLMFLIGLEMSMQRVWSLRRWVLGVGSAQVLLSAAAIGVLAWLFGNGVAVSVVLGLVLSLSSTAVVMQLLAQQRALATPLGQASFSVLVLQDFAVVPVLIVVQLLARDSSQGLASQLLVTAALSTAVIALILLAGRLVVGPLFRTFARQRQAEVFVALTLLVTLGIAGATAMAGLSMALGAFLAGLLLAETEYRHEIEVTVEPFKGLLMGLFFMSVGMGIDLRELAREPLWLAFSVVGLLVVKAVIVAVLFRLGGLPWGQALHGGLLLGQGGEFAFVVIGVALGAGLLAPPVGQFMLLVVTLSLLATPLYARLGQQLEARLAPSPTAGRTGLEAAAAAVSGHVVVVGFGRVGRLLGQAFAQQAVPYVGVDQDVQRVAALRERGEPVFLGNGARAELLRKLGLERAACLVVTMDEPGLARHVVTMARRHYPELRIYARSHDEQHARELLAAGATQVIPEVLEAGLQLLGLSLQALGLPDGDAEAVVAAERASRAERTAG
ncbi:cation:proton antiporter [Ramlibacter sp.]|uniref:cation:proton antiporter domain-containing protein n=1 Tax=Ramlibacter sp. TaxID=1917967 RepID=UPI0035AFB0B9